MVKQISIQENKQNKNFQKPHTAWMCEKMRDMCVKIERFSMECADVCLSLTHSWDKWS